MEQSLHPIDVDVDNFYTAGDTLAIIIYPNSRLPGRWSRTGASQCSFVRPVQLSRLHRCDSDNFVTAGDTIAVINWLNSRLPGAGPGPVSPGQAEGEGEAANFVEFESSELFVPASI